jgi:tetratricopeptide (TPR) repeat protein
MIELLLQAERAVGIGALDQAERLYWQAIDADPQNAIAIVGLAKVARMRGDDRTAIAFGRRALKVDAENAVAQRLVAELESGHPAAPAAAAAAVEAVPAAAAPEPVAPPAPPAPVADPAPAEASASTPEPSEASAPAAEPTDAPPTGPQPADPGVRPPRGSKADLEWPAADLQQVRHPKAR